MAQTQHAPGPWRFNDDSGTIEAESGRVAHLNASDFIIKEDERNGALIAAAPDMLEALIEAERLFEHTWAMNGTIHVKMRAAIAKAEGRSNG